MDKVSVIDITFPKDDYVLDRQLLSPTVNPYGSPNSQGIYVINCSDKDVIITRSRIVGTVVLLAPGGNSIIKGSMCWEPPANNFPALLSNDTIAIALSSAGLTEDVAAKNLNPPGTPYPFNGGVANSTMTNSYPSKINGIVYSGNDLNFSSASTLQGVVIAERKIRVNAASLNLSYVSTYFNTPPPGFDVGAITMKAVAGTWRRIVD